MSKRGGYIGEGVVNSIGEGVNAANTAVGSYVIAPVTGATQTVIGKAEEGVKGTGSWFGSFFSPAPAQSCPPCPSTNATVAAPAVAAQSAGSRRRKRSGRKSKNMFSGLMKMVGFKTKKRGRKGGIGGPSNGYEHIVGANFPSAANAQGNTIYDLAPFDPLKPFTGGMKGAMKGGCMPSKFIPLSPAPFPGDGMIGGKSKRHRKRRGGTKKW
jgi:hypothetical protein